MRILHTSDWHLGQFFLGKSRQTEHRQFIEWLIRSVVSESIDCVLIAGDIFDTGSPPSYARELYNRLIIELHQLGVQLVILGGNHDSVATLNESRELVACLSTQVVPVITPGTVQNQILPLYTRAHLSLVAGNTLPWNETFLNNETFQNKSGQPTDEIAPAALLCAVPFIRPRDILRSQSGDNAQTKQQQLGDAIREYYQSLFDAAESLCEQHQWQIPIIGTGHLTALGSVSSESEREIYVGTLESLAADQFPPLDYLALGHIHRPQTVGGKANFRYSGSPIPLSFDEAGQEKQVVIIEIDGAQIRDIRPLSIPCFQPLQTLKGNLKDLESAVADAVQNLTSGGDISTGQNAAGSGDNSRLWLDLVVTEDDYLSDLQNRLLPLAEQYPVEILRIRRARSQVVSGFSVQEKQTLAELSPEDVFIQRMNDAEIPSADQDVLMTCYRQVLNAIQDHSSSEPDVIPLVTQDH